jgi:hypothetical protein
MESALRLFGIFHVNAGPVLHESETAVVFKAIKYDEQSDDEDYKAGEVDVPTALKCMRDLDQVRTVLPFEELRFLVSNNPVIFHERIGTILLNSHSSSTFIMSIIWFLLRSETVLDNQNKGES